ncbi:MAG TPA: hypothetical protein VKW76_13150 [Candidatus Binatia bacterium]|nr:hypothetical protein [Candidatus Binatia bacterium]
MARVLGSIALVGLALWPAAALRAQAVPSSSPFGYALFGLTQTRLAQGVEVFSGDVGTNVGTVAIGAGARVGGNVAAFSIRLAKGARVARHLFCLFLDGATNAQCRSSVSVPLVSAAALPAVAVAPGTTAVRVAPGRIVGPLVVGAYGRVRLGAHAGLLLAGGTYTLRALRLAPHAELVCAAACRIQVLDAARLGAGAQVSPAPGLADAALEIDVAAGGAAPAFHTGPGAAVTGIVYAPAGGVVLGAKGRYEGSFVGATVRVGAGAQVLGASGS